MSNSLSSVCIITDCQQIGKMYMNCLDNTDDWVKKQYERNNTVKLELFVGNKHEGNVFVFNYNLVYVLKPSTLVVFDTSVHSLLKTG